MKTRIYSEGKNSVLGEKYFSAVYAIPIFSRKAVNRWLRERESVINIHSEEPARLFRVRTLSMNLVQDAPLKEKQIQTS